MFGLTEDPILSGGVAAGLIVVGTFCWCWRLRCWTKNALKVLDKLVEVRLTLEQRGTSFLRLRGSLPGREERREATTLSWTGEQDDQAAV